MHYKSIIKRYLLILLTFLFTGVLQHTNAQINLKKAKETMATVKKGPCDSALKSLNRYLEKLETKKAANETSSSSFKTYISNAERNLKAIQTKCPDLDISNEKKAFDSYKVDYENEASLANSAENAANYFRDIHMYLNHIYSDTEHGADAAQGLKFVNGSHNKLYETVTRFANFNKSDYMAKVEASKTNGTYTRVKFYVEQVVSALNDYPNFINKSQGTYKAYLDYMNNIGIKGDPQKELEELEATKAFCQLLLKFAPNNAKATQWLKEVENQIGKKTGGITYASEMHKKHLGKILFSKKEVAIGNESENDFSTNFKSGDNIYATVYLPSKLRQLTDSYAANDVKVKVNSGIISEPSSTAVWVTTPMQEKNYLQLAILPSNVWKQKNGTPYVENKLRTHEHIANALLTAGPYSGTTIDIEVVFRGTNSSIKGGFTIDQSSGVDHLKQIVGREENARLKDEKLPKRGMSGTGLENQALTIMRKKSSSSGKTYTKAIITSVNWDYDKTYSGVIVSRSLSIALVSKEHDGKCMYQYFNFKQQAQGNGSFNNNLEFAGAGTNAYISCDNIN
ncbi:hypothetical protein [Flavivirga spongiicola]|uniref:Uncharacterized protein n=1 Tax=Flavivirga spongiicola TaxID=421621 RepID=A0ABU7XP51_9FLAO|nr:hypothetical protein [Flavivirga sp. MEBiC05379]MDO5981363.1 hypothetical protein [Flavivirga sp. MEBiC05379]